MEARGDSAEATAASLAQKFRGALVGVAVGDTLGAPFEGSGSVSLDALQDLERPRASLRYTDDTHMALGLAQSLVEKQGFDGAHTASVFAQNHREQPWRGYGPGPPQVFELLSRGVPWDQAGGTLFDGKGSFGNGAAMRVAPVALLAVGDLDLVSSLARQSAVITHAHELGVEGAVLQACAVSLALEHDPARSFSSVGFLDALQDRVSSPIYREKLERIGQLLQDKEENRRETAVARLDNGIAASESVPTAIYAFLRHPTSFQEVVAYAISLGGDTDTIASMGGALAGAHLGLEAIPNQWADGVEDGARLLDLADSLLSLASRRGKSKRHRKHPNGC